MCVNSVWQTRRLSLQQGGGLTDLGLGLLPQKVNSAVTVTLRERAQEMNGDMRNECLLATHKEVVESRRPTRRTKTKRSAPNIRNKGQRSTSVGLRFVGCQARDYYPLVHWKRFQCGDSVPLLPPPKTHPSFLLASPPPTAGIPKKSFLEDKP